MYGLASAPGIGIWVAQVLMVKQVWREAVQPSNGIIHRPCDIHLLVVTAAPLRYSVQMCKELIVGTTSSLQVWSYLGMTALQRESWAHI